MEEFGAGAQKECASPTESSVILVDMLSSLVFALATQPHLSPKALVTDNRVWEEDVLTLKQPTPYHPCLQFKPDSTFILGTPTMVAQGHYVNDGTHYTFHPETADDLNHADMDKLAEDAGAETGPKMQTAYRQALSDFDADYDASRGTLNLNYKIGDAPLTTYILWPYTGSDDQRTPSVSEDERGLVGLWRGPEPFPERLDSKTRFRIGGLDGLKQFAEEARACVAAQFALLDLRADKTFRIHDEEGEWYRKGSELVLQIDIKLTRYTISQDGTKLNAGGKTAYIHNW